MTPIETAAIVIGIILIVCGFLVKKYPNLIAGYNSMPNEEKKKIDNKRLGSAARNLLIFTGALHIIMMFTYKDLGFGQHEEMVMGLSLMIPLVLGVIWLNTTNFNKINNEQERT